MSIETTIQNGLFIITINRPHRRNAIDRAAAEALYDAFLTFEQDPMLKVAILTGAEGQFCAGADLKAIAEGEPNRLEQKGSAPMGPSRMLLTKPLIAAIEGHAVAGGLELALLADLRVAARNSILGVFCRRVGVPLIDGGTVRLPRLIGQGRALDLILTGRSVDVEEALSMGLISRIAPPGESLSFAIELAELLCSFPEDAMLGDRRSLYEQFDLELDEALQNEFNIGLQAMTAGEAKRGAQLFSRGHFRHGTFN